MQSEDVIRIVPVVRACDQCGRQYEKVWDRAKDRFCSNACKSAFRRSTGVDNETRDCAWCGNGFVIGKYLKGVCCSPTCAALLRGVARRENGDGESVVYKGKTYSRYPHAASYVARHYFRCRLKGITYLLHHEIWEDSHGAIPRGYHIHHISGDPSDNRIENLALLSPTDHYQLHVKERRENPYERVCEFCQKAFTTASPNLNTRFCSASCSSRSWRREGKDNITQACEVCGKDFTSNRHDKTRTCSHSCANFLWHRRKANTP